MQTAPGQVPVIPLSLPSPENLSQLRCDLLNWYDLFRRPLPWRRRPSLYGTWIAEIMLQQTTVPAVVPYWQRFLIRFPDIHALAAASEEELLALWSGLGYYRRVRRLHQAARLIVAEHAGRWPRSRDAWLELPGIGRYSAGAIASIGLGERVPAVDANARRVITRWVSASAREAESLANAELEDIAARAVDPQRPGDWNQAVMEFGALVCRRVSPTCGECRLARHCRAHAAGRVDEVPPPLLWPSPTPVLIATLVVRRRENVLLVPAGAAPAVRMSGYGRPERGDITGLWQGLWAPPCSPWYRYPVARGLGTVHRPIAAVALSAWRRWLVGLDSVQAGDWSDLGSLSHAVTTYKLHLHITAVSIGGRLALPDGVRWYRPGGRRNPPLSSLAKKILARSIELLRE